MPRYALGQLVLILLVVLAIAMIGGQAATWLHPLPWALVLVVAAPLAALLAIHPWAALRQAVRDAGHPSASSPSGAASAGLWRRFESFIYAGALLGALMGWMVTFSQLSPDLARLGTRLAACLVPPFFGVLLGLACRVLRARIETAS